MSEFQKDVAAVVDGLSPIARWFVVLSLMAALLGWSFADVPYADWPPPVSYALWLWLVVAALTPTYIWATRVVALRVLWESTVEAKAVEADGVAPTPVEVQSGMFATAEVETEPTQPPPPSPAD